MITPDFTAVALFCEDIRDEVEETFTLVGLLPDNIVVQQLPGMLPKLAVLIRIHLRLDHVDDEAPLIFRIHTPGAETLENSISADLVVKSRADAEKLGTPFVVVNAKVRASPFAIKAAGQVQVTVEYRDSGEVLAAIVNLSQGEWPQE